MSGYDASIAKGNFTVWRNLEYREDRLAAEVRALENSPLATRL